MDDLRHAHKQLILELQQSRQRITELENALREKIPSPELHLQAPPAPGWSEFKHQPLQKPRIGTWDYTVATDMMSWSREMYDILSLDPQEYAPGWQHFKNCTSPQDWLQLNQTVRGAVADQKPCSEEFQIRHPDGRLSWMLMLARPVINEEGETIGLLGLAQDISHGKMAVAQLSKALQLLEVHMDNSPLAAVEFDADFRVSRWSKGAERLFGWRGEEILGKALPDVHWVHEEDQEIVNEKVADLLYGSLHRTVLVNRNYTKDGRVIFCEWHSSRIYDADNRLTSILALALDITARKKAELELKRMQDLHKQTERIARVGGWEWDVATNTGIWTDEVYHIHEVDPYEYDPSDLERNLSFFSPGDREILRQALQNCVTSGRPFQVELPLATAKGNRLWVLASGMADMVKDRVVRIFGNIMDITERKLAETALRESEHHFRTLAENSPDIIDRMDQEFRHLYINPAIEKATGIPAAAFIGRTNEEMGMPPENTTQWNQELRLVLAHGQTRDLTFTYEGPRGKRTFQTSLIPERGEDGRVGTVLAINRDITDSLNIEQQLRASKQKLEEQNFLLERKNTALQEMMQQVHEERCRIEKQVNSNVQQFVLPFIQRLKAGDINETKEALKVIEENLVSLTGDFGERISDKTHSLTKREMEVCNMIKSGLTTKEIAGIMDISVRGVETHRRNIRKKLRITKQKVNLAAYLSLL